MSRAGRKSKLPPSDSASPFAAWVGRAPPWCVPLAVPALAALCGLLSGAASPGGAFVPAWVAVYVPLFLALDVLARRAAGRGARLWLKGLAACLLAGVVHAALTGAWLVNTAHVYGHLPLPVAHGINLFAYGLLFGLETFFFLALPFLLGWRRPRWGFFLVLLWPTVLQAYLPRFFPWTFGMFLHGVPWPAQAADLVGVEGLNLLPLSLHLVVFGWLRALMGTAGPPAPAGPGRRELALATAGVVLLFAAASGYGAWRVQSLARATEAGAPVNLLGVQPNFSLRRLASNPALSHSQRQRSLGGLARDTSLGLAQLQPEGGGPTVVVWPESVFPGPFLRAGPARREVEQWARREGFHLVLSSLTYEERAGGGRSFRGSAIHVSPDGGAPEVYHKLTLIPFGETIPLGGLFPAYRRALLAWIPQISEFEAGDAFTVFRAGPGVRIAPMICFDVIGARAARGMRAAGANLGLVMANLAWFGRTNITDLFELFVRFRAMETRMPILMLSQNGGSMLVDAGGNVASTRLGQFQEGVLPLSIRLPETSSFFVNHEGLVHGAFALLLALLLAVPLAGLLGRGLRARFRGGGGGI